MVLTKINKARNVIPQPVDPMLRQGATGKIQKNRLREQFGDHLIGRRP